MSQWAKIPGAEDTTDLVWGTISTAARARAVAEGWTTADAAAAGRVVRRMVSGFAFRSTLEQRRAVARGPHRPARYAAFLDARGGTVLLLFDDEASCRAADATSRPGFAVVVREDQRQHLDAVGRVDVHGAFEAGSIVGATIAGQPVALASPLMTIDPEDLVAVVNASDGPLD